MTTAYIKGTPSSAIVKTIQHVKACAAHISHPLLMSMILLSYELSPENEIRQRSARDWLRRLEHAISGRDEIREDESYVSEGVLDMDGISRDMYECNGQVLWKKPGAYIETVKEVEKAMERFRKGAEDAGRYEGELEKSHRNMLSRSEFYMAKLKGLENYSWTTLERLRIQREAVGLHPQATRSLHGPVVAEKGGVLTWVAVQHCGHQGVEAQSSNRKGAEVPRPRHEARRHRHEDPHAPWRHLPAGDLPRLCV